MQTFLPYADFSQTAACLDRQRLGNQRNEAKVILKTLLYGGGWAHHPAVRMWHSHELALCNYGVTICVEWCRRGYKDKQLAYFDEFRRKLVGSGHKLEFPPWLGDDEFHASHRSNLLRKNLEHYTQFNWEEPNDLPYFWPVPKGMT